MLQFAGPVVFVQSLISRVGFPLSKQVVFVVTEHSPPPLQGVLVVFGFAAKLVAVAASPKQSTVPVVRLMNVRRVTF
ncbi:MAG: hypothetical protein V4710_04250 [Verrucomicrobiota bacterium]